MNFLSTFLSFKKDTLKLMLATSFVLLISGVHSQEPENDLQVVALTNPEKSGILEMQVYDGHINIVGHEGKNVLIEIKKGFEMLPDSSKAPYKDKPKNAIKLNVEEHNNRVVIASKNDKDMRYIIKVPKKFDLDLNARSGDITVENVMGEMVVSNKNGAVSLLNVRGTVVADALNKDITVDFLSVTENADMAFTSLNGDLNISFPKNIKADILALSEEGQTHIGLDVDSKDVNEKMVTNEDKNGESIIGTINGGGGKFVFRTVYGNIRIETNQR
ncbi:DUF4097 family beta strand repeat-containing protein [Ulvibacterium sp.]|uniref:DUF4097 family beta strand repeat-containing protein n=1 Tax=Ulvibacterium sp. TaxID=2665914 RepID=UPI003BAAD9B7